MRAAIESLSLDAPRAPRGGTRQGNIITFAIASLL